MNWKPKNTTTTIKVFRNIFFFPFRLTFSGTQSYECYSLPPKACDSANPSQNAMKWKKEMKLRHKSSHQIVYHNNIAFESAPQIKFCHDCWGLRFFSIKRRRVFFMRVCVCYIMRFSCINFLGAHVYMFAVCLMQNQKCFFPFTLSNVLDFALPTDIVNSQTMVNAWQSIIWW